jgi:two-component system, OmpR family, response regulator MprA
MNSDIKRNDGQSRVLVVDDDPQILVSLRRGLSLRGFDVDCSDNLTAAFSALEDETPDVVVLDVGMPGMDGITFCRLIRQRFTLPILMLTAHDTIEDRVSGLEAGADDYLVKPFALDELVARLRALMRRGHVSPENAVLSYMDVRVDRATWKAERAGQDLGLTTTEFRILDVLLDPPGSVRSREELLIAAWGGPDTASSNVVDVHVANLRRKMERGGRTRLVQAIRGVGYKLQDGP